MERNGLATAGLESKQAESLVILDARFRDLVTALMVEIAFWPMFDRDQLAELIAIREVVVASRWRLTAFGQSIVPKPEVNTACLSDRLSLYR